MVRGNGVIFDHQGRHQSPNLNRVNYKRHLQLICFTVKLSKGNFPWSCYFEFNPPQTRGAVIDKCLKLGKDQLEVGTAPLGPQYWEIW